MLLKTIFLSFLTISLLSNICHAEDSIYLNKDDKAPYSGYLLPEEEVKTLRNNTIERDAFATINKDYQTEISLYQTNSGLKDQQITLLTDQNTKLTTALNENRSLTNWEKVLYFGGGIIVTGLAIYGVHSIYK